MSAGWQGLRPRSRRARRIVDHVLLAVGSVVLTGVAYRVAVPAGQPMLRLTIATAYVGLALLGTTLLLGPLNVLRGRPNPVSTDRRRDIGIWAAILALVHTVVGLQIHMGGNMWSYFFYPPERPSRFGVRIDPFGVANHTGLVLTLIMVLLLALSNDRSLRWLGRQRWKAIHRSIYVGFVLLVPHGALYLLLERRFTSKRGLALMAAFAAAILVVGVVQRRGFRRMRERAQHAASGASPAGSERVASVNPH